MGSQRGIIKQMHNVKYISLSQAKIASQFADENLLETLLESKAIDGFRSNDHWFVSEPSLHSYCSRYKAQAVAPATAREDRLEESHVVSLSYSNDHQTEEIPQLRSKAEREAIDAANEYPASQISPVGVAEESLQEKDGLHVHISKAAVAAVSVLALALVAVPVFQNGHLDGAVELVKGRTDHMAASVAGVASTLDRTDGEVVVEQGSWKSAPAGALVTGEIQSEPVELPPHILLVPTTTGDPDQHAVMIKNITDDLANGFELAPYDEPGEGLEWGVLNPSVDLDDENDPSADDSEIQEEEHYIYVLIDQK